MSKDYYEILGVERLAVMKFYILAKLKGICKIIIGCFPAFSKLSNYFLILVKSKK